MLRTREKHPLSNLKLCIQIIEPFNTLLKFAISLQKSHLRQHRTSLQVCTSSYSHLPGISSCNRFACVVFEDFSEFLGVDLEISFGVQFGPTDLEDFGFVGFGGSDF